MRQCAKVKVKRMTPILLANPGNCNGCRLCELACSFENEGEFRSAKSRGIGSS